MKSRLQIVPSEDDSVCRTSLLQIQITNAKIVQVMRAYWRSWLLKRRDDIALSIGQPAESVSYKSLGVLFHANAVCNDQLVEIP